MTFSGGFLRLPITVVPAGHILPPTFLHAVTGAAPDSTPGCFRLVDGPSLTLTPPPQGCPADAQL